MKNVQYHCWTWGKPHTLVTMNHQCKETLSGTLCLAVTLPTVSSPE